MKQELDDLLCDRYPDVFRDRHNHSTVFGQRGFECGDGWFGLISQLAAALIETGCDIHVRQIKEKYGKLRTYVSGPEAAWQICQGFEELSATICEECSDSPAFISALDGYYRTRCASCYASLRKTLGAHSYDFADKAEIKRAFINHNQRALQGFVELYGINEVRSAWADIEPDQAIRLIQKVRGILGTIEKSASDQ